MTRKFTEDELRKLIDTGVLDAGLGAGWIRAIAEAATGTTPRGAVLSRTAAEFKSPLVWAETNLGLDLMPYQDQVLAGFEESDRVAAKGPRGLGKTFIAAVVVLWFADTRDRAGCDWQIVTMAGVYRQLQQYLWPRIHMVNRSLRRPMAGDMLLDMMIKGRFGRAFAASPRVGESIEGAHAEEVLFLFDESKIIDPGLFDSIEGADSGKQRTYMLAVSTPGAPVGRFYDIMAQKPGFERWWTLSVTVDDMLRMGMTTEEDVEYKANMWGRESSEFRTNVLGEFAADDEFSMIPSIWVEAAQDRWRDFERRGVSPLVVFGENIDYGLDIARHGRDKSAVAKVWGLKYCERIWTEEFTPSTIDLAMRVEQHMERVARIKIDADGMGTGAADYLVGVRGQAAYPFFGGEKLKEWRDASGYLEAFNQRSAAWWNMRELLDPNQGHDIMLPPDDGLKGDLSAVRRGSQAGSAIRIEEKALTKQRIGRSPDRGDAVVLAFWRPPVVAAKREWTAGYPSSGDDQVLTW